MTPEQALEGNGQETGEHNGSPTRRKPMMCRVPSAMVPRIENAARRLGLSASAFMVLSTAKELERLEGN